MIKYYLYIEPTEYDEPEETFIMCRNYHEKTEQIIYQSNDPNAKPCKADKWDYSTMTDERLHFGNHYVIKQITKKEAKRIMFMGKL